MRTHSGGASNSGACLLHGTQSHLVTRDRMTRSRTSAFGRFSMSGFGAFEGALLFWGLIRTKSASGKKGFICFSFLFFVEPSIIYQHRESPRTPCARATVTRRAVRRTGLCRAKNQLREFSSRLPHDTRTPTTKVMNTVQSPARPHCTRAILKWQGSVPVPPPAPPKNRIVLHMSRSPGPSLCATPPRAVACGCVEW